MADYRLACEVTDLEGNQMLAAGTQLTRRVMEDLSSRKPGAIKTCRLMDYQSETGVRVLVALNRRSKPHHRECVLSAECRGKAPSKNLYGITEEEDRLRFCAAAGKQTYRWKRRH